MIFSLVVAVSGVRYATSRGQQSFDPDAIPDDALPTTLRKRRGGKRATQV